ncbi:MAG TPA: Rieske (2Fe-2S) protein, partial [Terriglobia bacterium]|nr:Rieske (2Fe-2S) protein [Terriglobia bacterium]
LLDRQSHDFNIGNLQPLHRFTSRTILGPRGSGIQFYYAALLMTPRLEGCMAPVYPLGVNVFLARVGGAVYAVSGKCAHMACPLFMGRLEGYTVVCPCHDWRFDVRTGRFLDAPELALTVYPTKLEAGKLSVSLG